MILGLQKEKNLKSGIIFLRDLSNRNYSWAKHQKRIFYFRHSTGNREVFIRIYRILKSKGFKYKIVNNRKILCEQKLVKISKMQFLRKFLQMKNVCENFLFVYLDETWMYRNGSQIRRWVHNTELKCNPSKFKSEGKQFTIQGVWCLR
jgi:hypothetical protein